MGNDLKIYDSRAAEWWDDGGTAFRSLRAVHAFRSRLLFGWLDREQTWGPVVDVGCGGGYFAEDFAKRGARVVGVDLSAGSLGAARAHGAALGPAAPAYVRGDARFLPLPAGFAEGVVLADVLEHLDWRTVLREAARVLRQRGWVYVSTINRTIRARVLGVWAAEGLGFIPRGTHDPSMFIRPEELSREAAAAGLRVEMQVGERPRIAATLRGGAIQLAESRSLAVAYSVLLRKD